jgi:hypothetical protein
MNMKRWFLAGGLLVVALIFPLSASLQETPEGLHVDAGQELGEVSPYVYGANYSPLGVITVDNLDAAYNSGITFLRYPGGRVGDEGYLTNFQVDSTMNLVRQMGAEPFFHVRLENGTPEKAVEILQYTIDKGYNVRYWGIGNEPNLFDNYTTDVYVQQWRAIAEAMLAVDPDLILIGPEVSQWNGTPQIDPVDANGKDWLREFLLANGDLVDIVAVHRYPFPQGNDGTTIEDLRGNVHEWSNTLDNLRAVVQETTGRELPVAVTEANSHWSAALGGEASPDSHYNAIWWADVLGRLIQDDPFAVGYFQLQSSDGLGGWGLLEQYTVRPTYYVYQVYKQFGTQRLLSESGIEDVNVYAAKREDGALTLVIVNLTDSAQEVPLRVDNFTGSEGQVWLFDAEHPTVEEIEPLTFAEDMMLALTPQSITLAVFEAQE